MTGTLREVATEAELVDALGPASPSDRALILIGGADQAGPAIDLLRGFFATLAAYCDRTGTTVVDGGTDTGVMRLIAEARTAIGGTFPLIGVTPSGALERSTRTGGTIRPARDHSAIYLVPGTRFGDGTSALFAAADHRAAGAAPTVLVNGGHLSRDEALLRLAAGHLVIAVAGSGRAADDLVADEGLRASGKMHVVQLDVDDAGLAAAIDADARGWQA